MKENKFAIPIVETDNNKFYAISEENPFKVGKLKIFPDRFEYKNEKFNFSDINHIGWYHQSQTINFLFNIQNAHLTLYLKNREEPIYILKQTMYFTPKIVLVYNFIAQETFQRRLNIYTRQLEKSGSFLYDGFNIHIDGRITSNGETFYISEVEFDIFHITLKKGFLSYPKRKINLKVDRDVCFFLLNLILQNTTQD